MDGDPTPAEIEAECVRIQKTWTKREERARRCFFETAAGSPRRHQAAQIDAMPRDWWIPPEFNALEFGEV